jgi:hypothetical protein
MTKQRAKELAPIIKAYSENVEVQYHDTMGNWVKIALSDWHFEDPKCIDLEYRIKPEPKYRPFKTVEEVEAVFGKSVKWISNPSCSSGMIVGARFMGNTIRIYTGHGVEINADYAIKEYIFTDGTPCGVQE